MRSYRDAPCRVSSPVASAPRHPEDERQAESNPPIPGVLGSSGGNNK